MSSDNVIPFPLRQKPLRTVKIELEIDEDDFEVHHYRITGATSDELGSLCLALHRLASMVADSYRTDGHLGNLDEPIFSMMVLRSSAVYAWFENDEYSRTEDIKWIRQRLFEAFQFVRRSSLGEHAASGAILKEHSDLVGTTPSSASTISESTTPSE